MTNYLVCIACLSSNIKMCSIIDTQLPEIYEKLTNIKLFNDNVIPKTMCYICYNQLQKCYRFMKKSQKAAKILTQLLSDGIQLTQETVSALDETTRSKLLITVLKPTSVPPIEFYNKEIVEAPSNSVNEKEKVAITQEKLKEELQEIDEQMSIEVEPILIKKEPIEEVHIIVKECTQVKNVTKIKKETQIIKKVKVCKQDQLTGNKEEAPHANTTNTKDNNLLKLRNRKINKKRTRTGREKNHECDNCDMKFSCKAYLIRHMRVHTGERPFACKSCNKTFAQTGHLAQHMRLHTGEKPYVCHICENKAFNHRYNYKTHMRKHFGVPSEKCELCNAAFHQKGDLKRHIMSHTGERPYTCNTCDLKFTQNCHLIKHKKLHMEKPYGCTYCELEFSRKLDLKNHLITHTGHRLYPCSVPGCSKSFNRQGMLTNHLKVHTNETLYACDKCNKTFKQKGHLTKHTIVVHGNNQFALKESQSGIQQNKTGLGLNREDVKFTQVDLPDYKYLPKQEHVEEYIIP